MPEPDKKLIPFATVKHTFAPSMGLSIAATLLRSVEARKLLEEDQILFHATEDPENHYIDASGAEAIRYAIETCEKAKEMFIAYEKDKRERN